MFLFQMRNVTVVAVTMVFRLLGDIFRLQNSRFFSKLAPRSASGKLALQRKGARRRNVRMQTLKDRSTVAVFFRWTRAVDFAV